MMPISSLFDIVSLFFEINFLVHMKGSFLVVDQGFVDAVSFAGEGEPSPRVVVDDAVAVGGHRIINISDAAGDGSIPCNFGINDFHFRGLVGTDPFVRTGQGPNIFQPDTTAVSMNVETIVPGIFDGQVANDDVGAGNGYAVYPIFCR